MVSLYGLIDSPGLVPACTRYLMSFFTCFSLARTSPPLSPPRYMKIYILLIVLHVALAIMPRCWGCRKEFRRLGSHTENCPQVLALLQGRLQEQMEHTARLEAEERDRVRRAEEEARRTRELAEQAEAERRARIEVSNDVSFFA